ncbi:MAG: hypothetical protein AB7S54_10855 [Bacteroidales bacterium]
MRKVIFNILVFSLFVIALAGCKKDDASEDSIAPKNIVGKQLLFNGGSYDVSEFTSNGTCKIPEGTEYGITTEVTKTPRYTYKRSDLKTASFTCNYSEKSTILSNYTYYDASFDLTLSFITTTSGTLTGTVNFIKTGGNGGKSMYFTFKDKAFTLQ